MDETHRKEYAYVSNIVMGTIKHSDFEQMIEKLEEQLNAVAKNGIKRAS